MDGRERRELLRMAEELSEMDKEVPSDVSDFLEQALVALRDGEDLDERDKARLKRLHAKYVGDDEDDDGEEERRRDDDDDDPDPDDFV